MKPKSKKITTPEQPSNVTAITTAPKTAVTVWDALDKTCKDLSSGDTSFIQAEIKSIQTDMIKINELKDNVATHLVNIHSRVGAELFGKMANEVFPRLGLSRSSVYRLLDSGTLLKSVLPDPVIRNTLLGRTEKNFTTTNKDGKVVLHPAFEKALKKVEGTRVNPTDAASVGAYTDSLLKHFQELGKPKQKTTAQKQTEASDRLKEGFQNFMKAHGTKNAEMLLQELEEILENELKTVDAPKPATSTKTATA